MLSKFEMYFINLYKRWKYLVLMQKFAHIWRISEWLEHMQLFFSISLQISLALGLIEDSNNILHIITYYLYNSVIISGLK